MDHSRLLIGGATHFDRIHSARNFDLEAKRIMGFLIHSESVDEMSCATGELGLAIKRLGFKWRGYESRPDLRHLAIAKHGADVAIDSMESQPHGSMGCIVGWFAPLSRIAPARLCDEMGAVSKSLALGGRALIEDWLRPDEARSGWALMDCHDGDDFKLTRVAVAHHDGQCARFEFEWLAAKIGEQPSSFREESVAWLHGEKFLLNSFQRVGLKAKQVMIDGLRCWDLSKF